MLDQTKLHDCRLFGRTQSLQVPGTCSLLFCNGANAGVWMEEQAVATRVPAVQTSTHLESASASHRGAAASLLQVSPELAWRLHHNGKHTCAGASLECQRHKRARTLRPPPPRTEKQPQPCSRSFAACMAAPLQRQTHTCRCLVGMPASHRGAAASLLVQVGACMAAPSQRQTHHL